MAEKVELRLTGRQRDETGEENVTELLTEAQLFRRNGSIVILYEETQEGVGTKNTLKLKGDVLELVKAGSVRTRMTFQEGKEYLSDYATPYGCLQMGIRTDALTVLREERQIEIRIEYTLTSGGEPVSDCMLTIQAVL